MRSKTVAVAMQDNEPMHHALHPQFLQFSYVVLAPQVLATRLCQLRKVAYSLEWMCHLTLPCSLLVREQFLIPILSQRA
jgi:hypothetical protein